MEIRLTYYEESSDADDQARDRGGRWLCVKGGDFVLYLLERQGLQVFEAVRFRGHLGRGEDKGHTVSFSVIAAAPKSC